MRVPRDKAKLQVIQTGEGQSVNSGVDFGVFRVVGEGGWVRIVAEVDQFFEADEFSTTAQLGSKSTNERFVSENLVAELRKHFSVTKNGKLVKMWGT